MKIIVEIAILALNESLIVKMRSVIKPVTKVGKMTKYEYVIHYRE